MEEQGIQKIFLEKWIDFCRPGWILENTKGRKCSHVHLTLEHKYWGVRIDWKNPRDFWAEVPKYCPRCILYIPFFIFVSWHNFPSGHGLGFQCCFTPLFSFFAHAHLVHNLLIQESWHCPHLGSQKATVSSISTAALSSISYFSGRGLWEAMQTLGSLLASVSTFPASARPSAPRHLPGVQAEPGRTASPLASSTHL